MIQVCRDNESVNRCSGVLLTHSNGNREALGQVRFDKHLSEKWEVRDCVARNGMTQQALFVELRKRSDVAVEINKWYDLPREGKMVWWCGLNGDQLGILG